MRIENDPGLNSQSFNDHEIFTINELNELFPVVKPYFSALHLNIRSLNQHFADLCNLLDSTPLTFDFIGCSETKLSSQSYFRGTQREYSSKPLKHSTVKRILVFKR